MAEPVEGIDMAKRTYKSFPNARTLEEAFWMRVKRPVDEDACWVWLGSFQLDGYGRVNFARVNHVAHRLSYELNVGPIPEGLVIDHLCRNRGCCNPRHLEPVTAAVNTMRGVGYMAEAARKTHCPAGHEYAGTNLYLWNGYRHCRTCKRAQWRAARARQRARLAAAS